MALYKYRQHLESSTDSEFDARYAPGTAAPHPGIYRCAGCGDEIGIAKSHALPPQNHHQHSSDAKVEWQLLVYAEQRK
jgi:hypothetical protein